MSLEAIMGLPAAWGRSTSLLEFGGNSAFELFSTITLCFGDFVAIPLLR
jgi:hypothetical protein